MSSAPKSGLSLLGSAQQRVAAEAIAWIAFGGFLWFLTGRFEEASSAYRFGPASWPRAIIVLMVCFAALHWLGAVRRPQPEPAAAAGTDAPTGGALSLLIVFLLPLAYAWLLPRTGFFATTPVFIGLLLWLLGERVWRRLLLATAIIWSIVVLVFTVLLYVPLPTGNWPVFYDFSNFVLALLR